MLVGINLLRESGPSGGQFGGNYGRRLRKVLRSRQALIQTIGRTARHVDGAVMYGDNVTDSMRRAVAKRIGVGRSSEI